MPFTFTNLLRPGGTWETGGPGTATIDPVTGNVNIVTDGTATTWARRAIATTVNKRYVWTWTNDNPQVMSRLAGSAPTLSDLVGPNASATGDNRVEFTATTTTSYVTFQRPTAGTANVSSPVIEELPAQAHPARRTNGRTQFFSLDAQAGGYRISNAMWYVGGWVAFHYMPTTAVYLADFGRLDPASTAGGAGRVRLFWDPDAGKLACSTAESASTNYRENYIISALVPDRWYYVGVIAHANADVRVVLDLSRGPSYIGTTLPPISATEICRVLQIGARVATARTHFAPCRFSNWIWTSGWIPTDAQLYELASGTQPQDASGLTPPAGTAIYHWPMSAATGDEASIRGVAVMVPTSPYGSPINVPGPIVQAEAAPSTPLDVIVV